MRGAGAHHASPRKSYIFRNFKPFGPLGSSTVGCTAMDIANLHDVLAWLDPAASPLVVQLPQATYDVVKTAWGLP